MSTETATAPAGGDATSPETEVATSAPEVAAPAGGSAEGEPTATTDPDISDLLPTPEELAEVEYEGAKLKVPAILKDAIMRHQDYTVKTQTLADERRTLASDRQQVEQVQRMSRAEIEAVAEIHSLNAQLQPFINAGIDWDLIADDDPEYGALKSEAKRVATALQAKQARLDDHFNVKRANAERDAANARQAVEAQAAKQIKDWSPERRQALEQFAVEKYGISAENAADAGVSEFKLLDDAYRWNQFLERTRQAAKASADARTQPAAELGQGSGSGTSDPAQMTMAQYRAWRAKQDRDA